MSFPEIIPSNLAGRGLGGLHACVQNIHRAIDDVDVFARNIAHVWTAQLLYDDRHHPVGRHALPPTFDLLRKHQDTTLLK